jgi:hypothetical protein
VITREEELEILRIWEHPLSMYGPDADEDALRIDGIVPLPGLSWEELRHHADTVSA